MQPSGSMDDAELFDFLDEYHRDLDAGREHGLAHYLVRYPGHEEAIAREFVRLTGGATAEPSDDALGPTRIGPYVVLRELGRGGQGTVLLAEDTRIARRVALKCLPSSFALLSPERRRRFQREAQLVSRLEHPSICPVFEAEIDHDPPYIAMRYVEGVTLAAAIKGAREGQRDEALPLPPKNSVELRRVLLFFERTARALHAAHEAGVIHRDIKPGNVMVSKSGEPVVLDFGQARDELADFGDRTLSGEVLGTPAYMSPEQIVGSARGVDRRTDVWSLGASLYEALTLERPFDGASVAALMHSISTAPLGDARTKSRTIDDDLATVLETALEKDTARRYATALELAEDLRRIREYEPIHARPAGPMLRLRRWAQRHPAVAVSVTTVILSLSIGLAWSLHLLRREQLALDHALGRHLAERATELLDEDSSASLALGIEAVERAPCYQTRAALLAALEECQLAQVLDGEPAQFVRDFDIAPDSVRVLAGLSDRTTRVWNLRTGAELARFPEHPGEVERVRMSPDGSLAVTATSDRKLRLWSLDDATLVRELEAPGEHVLSLAFGPSGARIAALAGGGALAVLDVASAAPLADLALGSEPFGQVEFSRDGELLLVSSVRRPRPNEHFPASALVLRASDVTSLGALDHDGAAILWAELAPDSKHALTASDDGSVRLWRVPECEPDGGPLVHGAPVSCARFTPDGTHVVSGTDDGARSRVNVWSLATRERRVLEGRQRGGIVSIDVSRDGRKIVADTRDPLVSTWTIRGELLTSTRIAAQPLETRWTPDGRRMLTIGLSAWIHVWWGENRPDLYALRGDDTPVTSVSFSESGEQALTLAESGVVRVFHTPMDAHARGDHAPGEELARLHADDLHFTEARFTFGSAKVVALSLEGIVLGWDWLSGNRSELARVDGAAIAAEIRRGSDEGWSLAVVSSTGHVYVVGEPRSEAPELVLDDRATCAEFVPASEWLAVGRSDSSVRVYDVATGELVREQRWNNDRDRGVVALAVRPDGRQLAVACGDLRVRFFAPLGEDADRPDLIVFPMHDLAYNRDGTRLLATGPRGASAIRLQNLVENRVVRNEIMHAANLTGGCFDATGRMLLTSSEDGTVIVRDATNGEPIAQLAGHTGSVLCASFHTDGVQTRVITGSDDGTARVWPVDPVAAARARKPRELRDYEIAREQRLAEPLRYR